MGKIFFSVIIPTYNRAHLISKTIESVLAQTFTDFEIIIVDDGSKDDTEDVVKKFSDPRIKYFLKENGERGAARNFGLKKASGTYVNFFDSDDLMYSHHLQYAAELIQRQDPDWFHLGYDFKDASGVWQRNFEPFKNGIEQKIIFDNCLSCNGVFIRRLIALDNPFHEDRELASSEDWELWIRLLAKFPFVYSNEVTSTVFNHDNRSLFTIQADKIIARDTLLVKLLEANKDVMQLYKGRFNRFKAERFTFFMLSLAEQKQKLEVIRWSLRAVKAYPFICFSKRYLASLKNILLL
jgi:glycosyltransferase involved in cell wall biosynthesis